MTTLRLIRENTAEPTQQVMSALDVYKAMRFLEEADREKFYVLHLDSKNMILAMELISIGSLSAAIVHPREVFKGAVINNSCAIICVHNHPSGDPKPSMEDVFLTGRLEAAGDILGIKVHDHVIIGRGGFSRVMTPAEEAKAAAALQLQNKKSKARKNPRVHKRGKKTKAA